MAVRDMVAIAMSQLGNGGYKFYTWAGFGYRVDWCAIFMSWCAEQAGYTLQNTDNIWNTSSINATAEDFPRYYTVGRGARWFQLLNRLQISACYGGTYTPQRGDIVFFTWSFNPYDVAQLDHTGIVEKVENGNLYTIEGNSGDLVKRQVYGLTEGCLAYYGQMNGGTFLSVSDDVIAAICGNLWRESTVNPGIWETLIVSDWYHVYQYDGIGGFGLGGFTNVTGPYGVDMRLGRYHDWCVANGYSEGDGNSQLYYIIFVERLWKAQYNNVALDEWLASTSTDLYQLTDDWCRWWEGNPNDHMPERYSYAQQALAYIQQHKNDNASDYNWISGNFYNDTAGSLNNVMCVYFWFTHYYAGGGGGVTDKKRKIPLWMMLRHPKMF